MKILLWRDISEKLAAGLSPLVSDFGLQVASFSGKFGDLTTHDSVVVKSLKSEGGWSILSSNVEGKWTAAKLTRWKALDHPVVFLHEEVASKHVHIQAATILFKLSSYIETLKIAQANNLYLMPPLKSKNVYWDKL